MRRGIVLLSQYDPALHSAAVVVETGSVSPVQQHFGDEVDINTIVRRFGMTGQMPSGVPGGVYGDFTGIEDYESARDAVDRAQAGFMALPADVREKFGNDPGMLIAYAQGVPFEQLEAELRGEASNVEPVVAPVAPVVAPVVGPTGA